MDYLAVSTEAHGLIVDMLILARSLRIVSLMKLKEGSVGKAAWFNESAVCLERAAARVAATLGFDIDERFANLNTTYYTAEINFTDEFDRLTNRLNEVVAMLRELYCYGLPDKDVINMAAANKLYRQAINLFCANPKV